ncbi:MAG: fasciclin domain-containing protein [Anaerolineae bacterium]|nr:fasciclin domain-containing protein [Anaerolineae bacterium]
MRKVLLVFALLVVVAALAAPAFAQDERPTLAELLANDVDGRFTTLLAAIDAAGLSDTVADLDGVTLLAPTNDAFAASLEALGVSPAAVMANPDALTAILTYHILPERLFFRNLTSGPAVTTAEGEDVQFDLTDGVFTVNGNNISDVDNIASNGVMHVIDGVLVPPSVAAMLTAPQPTPEPVVEAPARPSIAEILANDADGRFTMLLAAIHAAGLSDTVANLDGVTILAPSNDAFTASLEALGVSPAAVMANPDVLTAILNYHILPEKLFFRNLTSGPAVTTAEGEDVQFDLTDGVFTVNGVNISDVDNVGSNGVVHVIDGVLVPPSVAASLAPAPEATPEATPEPETAAGPTLVDWLTNDADGRFSTLVAAIQAAGLDRTFAELNGATVLAPTNDAFQAELDFLGVTLDEVVANPVLLGQILRAHVIPGEYFFRNLTSGPALSTLAGNTVQFDLTDGVFTVNNIPVSDVDGRAANGVVQVIEGVILPGSVAAQFPANVRLANLPADAGDVDVYVNHRPALTGVAANAVSDWKLFPAGVYSIAVVPAGAPLADAILGPLDVTMAPGSRTTIAALGSVADGTLTASVIEEDGAAQAAGLSNLTVIHQIPDGPAVNVLANGVPQLLGLAYPGTAEGSDGVGTLTIPAGTLNIVINANGVPFVEAGAVSFDPSESTILVLSGTADAPVVTVFQVPAS